MDDRNDPPRGLEKVCHFFLTEETASRQEPGTSAGDSITSETTHITQTTLHQHAAAFNQLKNTVAQLYVLRESCKGMYYKQNPDNDIIWFKGAEAILEDAVENLIKTLHFIDKSIR